jgi:hypothetical protein
MDHVRRAEKLDASFRELCMGRANIGDIEIDDRLWTARVFRLGQEQANSIAIEKGEIAKGIEMPKTEHIAIPTSGFLNVPNGTRDLGNRSQRQAAYHHGLLLKKAAVATYAGPLPKLAPTGELEFLQYVGDVVFHCIRAHALTSRNFTIREAVSHRLSHAPFPWGQEIVITRPTAGLICWHEAYVIRLDTDLPYPPAGFARKARGEDILGPKMIRSTMCYRERIADGHDRSVANQACSGSILDSASQSQVRLPDRSRGSSCSKSF